MTGKKYHGSLRILIVDDNLDLRRHLGRIIELLGMEYIIASNEEEALGMSTRAVDIIVADIDLSEAGGDERGGILLANRLLNLGVKIPIILVSCVPSLLLAFDDEKKGDCGKTKNVVAVVNRNEATYVDILTAHLQELKDERLRRKITHEC